MDAYEKARKAYDKTGRELRDLEAREKALKVETHNNATALVERRITREEYDKRKEENDREFLEVCEREQVVKIAHDIEKDNLRRCAYNKALPVFVEVWNKYAGKQYGDKTREKITAEVKSRCGFSVSVFRRWSICEINFYTGALDALCYDDVRIDIYREEAQPLTADNCIHAITDAEKLPLYCCPAICNNPIKQAKAIIKQVARVRAKEGELKKEVANLNALLPARIDNVYVDDLKLYKITR